MGDNPVPFRDDLCKRPLKGHPAKNSRIGARRRQVCFGCRKPVLGGVVFNSGSSSPLGFRFPRSRGRVPTDLTVLGSMVRGEISSPHSRAVR